MWLIFLCFVWPCFGVYSIAGNGIGDDGAKALAEALKVNTVLQCLKLQGSPLLVKYRSLCKWTPNYAVFISRGGRVCKRLRYFNTKRKLQCEILELWCCFFALDWNCKSQLAVMVPKVVIFSSNVSDLFCFRCNVSISTAANLIVSTYSRFV